VVNAVQARSSVAPRFLARAVLGQMLGDVVAVEVGEVRLGTPDGGTPEGSELSAFGGMSRGAELDDDDGHGIPAV
jgi:hypothetical protein